MIHDQARALKHEGRKWPYISALRNFALDSFEADQIEEGLKAFCLSRWPNPPESDTIHVTQRMDKEKFLACKPKKELGW